MEEEKLIEAIWSWDQRARKNTWKHVAHEIREWVAIRSYILAIFLII